MKNLTAVLAMSLLALATAFAAEPASIRATLTLADNSTLKGTVAPETELQGNVVFMDGVKIPLSLIRELTADGTNGAQIATLSNGDKIHFAQTTKTLMVSSVLGDLSIPFANIRKATFSAVSGTGDDGLVFYCNFDSIEDIQKPVVGPAGTLLRDNLLEEGKVGNAMRVSLQKESARFIIPANFFASKGCIEWWAKIDSDEDEFYSCDPRFFLLRFTESINGVFEFSSNDGMGGGGIVVRLPGICHLQKLHFRSGWLYSQYFGNKAKDWHHYALVWNAEGISALAPITPNRPQLAIFIDGEFIPTESLNSRQKIDLTSLSRASTLNFPFYQGVDIPPQGHSQFLIDEMKIWNFDKTEFPAMDP